MKFYSVLATIVLILLKNTIYVEANIVNMYASIGFIPLWGLRRRLLKILRNCTLYVAVEINQIDM